MKITEEELKLRRERIIRCAFKLFCQRGIDRVTIKDVAKAADVSESTIYRYYKNKPKLVLATMHLLWHSIGLELQESIEATVCYDQMSGYQQLDAWIEGCRQLYQKNADYILFAYESKLYLQRSGIKLTQAQYDSLMSELEEPFVAALEKGKRDGSLSSRSDSIDLFYTLWGVLRGYIVKIVLYKALCEDGGPWESRYDLVKEGILRALAA